jgi:hypothetical protein
MLKVAIIDMNRTIRLFIQKHVNIRTAWAHIGNRDGAGNHNICRQQPEKLYVVICLQWEK